MLKEYIACDICGKSFKSYSDDCKRCEYYHDGFDRHGKTKSNLDYQIEVGLESLIYMANQIRNEDSYD